MSGERGRDAIGRGEHTIASRLRGIRDRIERAAKHAGRDASAITLVGVSKRQPIEALLEAYDAGLRDFGENQIQDLAAKAAALQWTGRKPRWHMVGRVQRNKINAVLPHVGVIQTVDRIELADALDRRLQPHQRLDVLVQVNIGREPQKGGVDPDEAVAFARAVAGRQRLRLRGLMAIPPMEGDPKPHFLHMAELLRQIAATPEGKDAIDLSLGMSEDFEQAVAAGATIVRVGTAIFGERPAASRAAG